MNENEIVYLCDWPNNINEKNDSPWIIVFLLITGNLTITTIFNSKKDGTTTYNIALLGMVIIDIGWLLLLISSFVKSTTIHKIIKQYSGAALLVGALCYFTGFCYYLHNTKFFHTCSLSGKPNEKWFEVDECWWWNWW